MKLLIECKINMEYAIKKIKHYEKINPRHDLVYFFKNELKMELNEMNDILNNLMEHEKIVIKALENEKEGYYKRELKEELKEINYFKLLKEYDII